MLQNTFFAQSLGLRINAVAVFVGTNRRNVDEMANTFLSRDTCDTLRTLMLHSVELVLARWRQNAHAVHNCIRALHHCAHGLVVANVAQDRFNLTHNAVRFHEDRFIRAAHGHTDPPALFGHAAGNVAPDKT